MKLQVARTVDAREWAELVARFGGNLYHSAEWAGTAQAAKETPLFFKFMEGDACVGVALGALLGRRFPLSLLSKRIRLDTYPCVRDGDPAALDDAVRAIVGYARRSGALSLELLSYASRVPFGDLAELGFRVTPRIEFDLDLTKTEEELWNGMASNRRGNIRKAERNGISVERLHTADALDTLSELSRQSMSRHGGEGIPLEVLLAKRKLFDAGLAEVHLARHDNAVVSAIMVTLYHGVGYSIHSGNSGESFKIGAPSLLRWQMVLDLKRRGFTLCTIGGVTASAVEEGDPQHGLYVFKRDFGGAERRCCDGLIEDMHRVRGAVARALRGMKR